MPNFDRYATTPSTPATRGEWLRATADGVLRVRAGRDTTEEDWRGLAERPAAGDFSGWR